MRLGARRSGIPAAECRSPAGPCPAHNHTETVNRAGGPSSRKPAVLRSIVDGATAARIAVVGRHVALIGVGRVLGGLGFARRLVAARPLPLSAGTPYMVPSCAACCRPIPCRWLLPLTAAAARP
jgi:hypothetical protein